MTTPMTADTIVLEQARPIEPELAARLIYDTGAYVFDCLYNRDFDLYLRITSGLWTRDSDAFSHVHARAAMSGGRLAASRSASRSRSMRPSSARR